ncbi:BamA/TamA family outer membrane protein [Candidatus Poribacteria bacterium]|nr:BamA/TamA family outer membrane protein [Candidatus Poribacteria bacterium]
MCCTCILLFGVVPLLFSQSETQDAVEEQESNSAQVWHKKLGTKNTWEKVISFPGEVIYLPLKLTFKLGAESIGFVSEKKVIPRIHDFLTSDDGRRGVLPTYAARTGGGVNIFQKGLISPESKLTLSLTAGLKGRQRYQLQFKRVALFGEALSSDFLVRYQLLSDESFFGIGQDSDKDDESNFAHEQATAQAAFGTKFSDRISLDAIFGFDLNDISEGKDKSIRSTTNLPNRESLPGLEEGISIGRLQIGIQYDSKNRPGNPTRGGEALLTAGIFQELDDDQFGFWKLSADLAYYLHLFYNRAIALRVAGEVTEPLSDREIPFYYLSELGRQETIRGFSRGRFRDRDMVLGSVEYRYPIHRVVDAMFFVDVGQVAGDIFSDFSTDDLEVGYGGGVRIWGSEGLISTFVVGKSSDGFRFYFGLN